MQSITRKKAGTKSSLRAKTRSGSIHQIDVSRKGEKFKDILVIAEERGLFQGARKTIVRGRMPEALVKKAKARTGIKSDTQLLEVALANLAVADDYPEWLLSRKGTIRQGIDLEF